MLEHEIPQGNLRAVQRHPVVDLLVEVGLDGLVVDALAHREHDDHCHENGEAGENLGGRQLLHAHGLAQEAEDDDDAREARHREHDGRRHGKHGEQEENFQQHRNLGRLGRPAGKREGHGGQREVLGGEGGLRQQGREGRRHHPRHGGPHP